MFYPFKEDISGICFKSASLIAINSKSTVGRQSFSLAHELYHYFFDEEESAISYFGDYKNKLTEKRANLFASYLLMPDSAFSRLCNKITNNNEFKIDLKAILEIEQYFNVSRSAVLIRLIQEGYLLDDESEPFKRDIILNAKNHGYDISLYLPVNLKLKKTFGAYLNDALEIKEKGLISAGKYEEYLLDAFRDDIVFGDETSLDIYD